MHDIMQKSCYADIIYKSILCSNAVMHDIMQ